MTGSSAARRLGGSAARRLVESLAINVLLAMGPSPAAAQATPATSLTIYSDGRVLVRRSLGVEVRKGESEQRVAVGAVNPGSVFPLDPDVAIVGATYDGAVDQQSVLRRALGRRLTFRSGRDTVSAELVGVDPERYRLPDGTITFDRPGVPQFPADLVILEPTLKLTLTSAEPKKDLRLGYFTEGGGWFASYQVIIARESARVMGQAVVNGGPLRLKEVELQLLAGQVNVAAVAGDARPRREAMMVAKEAVALPGEQKVGEFHVYTLPGRTTLEPGVTTTVALFAPAVARVRKSFEVRGQIPYWGGLPQYGEEDDLPVSVTYTVERPAKSDLGGRPLPGGVARLFEADSGGRLQLIGEAAFDHAPAGEDLRLAAGTAFDLTANRVQTSYVTRRDSAGAGRYRTVATADYRVTLTNAGTQAVMVDVIEERGGEWSIVSSSVKPVKKSSTRTAFPVPVPAGGKATLTYRVRVIW